MATKREIEIAKRFFYYGYHEENEIHTDDYPEIIDRDFPISQDSENDEFEELLEEMWQLWKAAKGE